MFLKPLELSRLLNLAPSTISMALRRGQLNKTRDGIDTDDWKNAMWIRAHAPDVQTILKIFGKKTE